MSRSALAEILPAPAPEGSPLSPEQIRLVRESFVKISPAIELVAQLFCRRLLDIAPDLASFIGADAAEQHKRIAMAFQLAVASLDRLDDVRPALKLIGVKQRAAGIDAEHYGAGGEALLWTLEKCLKNRFTPEVHDAWTALYTYLAEAIYTPANSTTQTA